MLVMIRGSKLSDGDIKTLDDSAFPCKMHMSTQVAEFGVQPPAVSQPQIDQRMKHTSKLDDPPEVNLTRRNSKSQMYGGGRDNHRRCVQVSTFCKGLLV
jgi:hypothetical protein